MRLGKMMVQAPGYAGSRSWGGIETLLDVQGETSLQALSLALKGLAAVLYGSDLYRSGRLGFFGDFSGYLGVPAPNVFLEEAPYPF